MAWGRERLPRAAFERRGVSRDATKIRPAFSIGRSARLKGGGSGGEGAALGRDDSVSGQPLPTGRWVRGVIVGRLLESAPGWITTPWTWFTVQLVDWTWHRVAYVSRAFLSVSSDTGPFVASPCADGVCPHVLRLGKYGFGLSWSWIDARDVWARSIFSLASPRSRVLSLLSLSFHTNDST
jgi:hypothetical protein